MLGFLKAYLCYPLAECREKRHILDRLRWLRQEACQPFAARKARLTRQLVAALDRAGHAVPYYRDLFASRNFSPEKLTKDLRYLTDLPWLTKEIVREQGTRLLSETLADRSLHERKTGSSTGSAVVIRYDQEALDWTAAQNIQVLGWGGKRRHHREVHLSTRFREPIPDDAARHEAWKCFVLNRANVYTGAFTPEELKVVWQNIQAAHPSVVQGHPSTMHALAHHVRTQYPDGVGRTFAIFVSTGELLQPRQRQEIEHVLGCRVSNRYGAAEFGVMAQELAAGPKDELLVCDSLVFPELADADAEGVGELAFTALRNPAMPLIRYRMGDLGRLEERDTGWWVTALYGRVHDVVQLDGRQYPTHYIQDILDRCGDIRDFQIAVRNGVAQELRLVLPSNGRDAILAKVRKNFPTLPTRVIELADLMFSGWRGKFRYVINLEGKDHAGV